MFTIAQWVVLVFLLLIGLGISVVFLADKDTRIAGLAIVFSTIIVFLSYFTQEEKVKWYKLLLYGVLYGCAFLILELCIIHPILILYIVLTIIVIAVIFIVVKTIKEDKD